EAAIAFERQARSAGDRQVRLRGPPAPAPGSEPLSSGFSCEALGYATGMQAAPLAALIPGYTPVKLPADNVFPSGILLRERGIVGIIKIPLFMARGFPSLCESAVDSLHIDRSKDCDSACDEALKLRAQSLITAQLDAAITAVEHARAAT